jgi:hypothetical protein
VFCAGLIKLWYINRFMRKHEILDEEKQARVREMNKTGLSVKKGVAVPFGVRAIQSGVEVEGIWVSRPSTPNTEYTARLGSSTTLVGPEAEMQRKAKSLSDDARSVTGSVGRFDRAPSHNATDAETASQHTSSARQHSDHARTNSSGDEDESRGNFASNNGRPLYETYTPTVPRQQPRYPGQHRSAASSVNSNRSNNHSPTNSNGSPSNSQNPFETPSQTPTGIPTFTMTPASTHYQEMPTRPTPTFGPGHPGNRPARQGPPGSSAGNRI